MANRPVLYHLHADGSASQNGRIMGAGYVLLKEHKKGKKPQKKAIQLAVDDEGSSTVAEIYAVCYGLHAIRHRAHVVVHTDEKTIRRVLGDPAELERWKKRAARKPSLSFALAALEGQIQRHRSVIAGPEASLASRFQREAHNLAREGYSALLRNFQARREAGSRGNASPAGFRLNAASRGTHGL